MTDSSAYHNHLGLVKEVSLESKGSSISQYEEFLGKPKAPRKSMEN
jgi:hypothetical protein